MSGTGCISTNAVSLNNWSHVSVSVDTFNNKVKIYLNGKLDSSHDFQLADKNATISGNTLTIGADPYNNHFSGLMYEPSLYYGAFSASKWSR